MLLLLRYVGGPYAPAHHHRARQWHCAPGGALLSLLVSAIVIAIVPAPLLAQDAATQAAASAEAGAPSTEPSAADRQAAADAFDRGTRAYLARDYARAAEWFETAYRMAPASVALIQAVRAHERAGNRRRAATLALRLTVHYTGDRAAMRQAEQTLRVAGELVRVDVGCSERCTIELDGALMELASFFIEPATEHTVRATFPTGSVEERVRGEAGEVRAITMTAPPAPVVAETTESETTDTNETTDPPAVTTPSGGGGLSPVFGLVGVGLTAVAGGVLIWSGLDTLDGVPAYNDMPTAAGLADGQSRELRTNVLIGVTAGLAAVSAVLLIVADWDGDPAPASEREQPAVVIAPTADGVMAAASGRF